MPNSRGRTTVCESSATNILLSSSQPIAVPGFLIFVIEPLGGPQVNLASTSADDLGTSFSLIVGLNQLVHHQLKALNL